MIDAMKRKIAHSRTLIFAKRNLVPLALVTLALVTMTTNVFTHSLQTSPIDELEYINYTDEVLTQGYVRLNEQVGEYTVHILSCDGIIPSVTYGECGHATASDLPYSGNSQVAPYTPLFFGVTAIVGGAIHLLTGIEKLTAWRLVGALWLAAAVLMMVLTFRRWKIPENVTLVLGAVVIASPYTWLAHTFLSTDAPSLFVGAMLLYVITRIRTSDLSALWLLLAFPVAIALKVTNIAAIILSIVYLAISWLSEYRRHKKTHPPLSFARATWSFILVPFIGLAISAALEFAWLRFIAMTAIPTQINMDQGVAKELSSLELLNQSWNFLSSSINANPLLTSKFTPFFTPLSWLCVAGVIGGFLLIRKWDTQAEMLTGILIATVIAAPLLALALRFGTGSYFSIEPRYGGALIPAFMLSTGLIMKNRVAIVLLAVYVVACLAVGLAFSVRLP
jgi:hypothetical protein